MAKARSYNKPWISIDAQIARLISRGFADAGAHRRALERIGYYRLSGYWYVYRELDPTTRIRGDNFFPDANLADVLALYAFDDRLRNAVEAASSNVEIALRSQLSYVLGHVDPFIHRRPDLLDGSLDPNEFRRFEAELDRRLAGSREDFVAHFNAVYGGDVPIWVITEIMQLGHLVKLFEFAPYANRVEIGDFVSARADEYRSWLRSINVVRNIAAHHGRLWNRTIGLKPKLSLRTGDPLLSHAVGTENKTYGVVAVLAYLLRQLDLHAPIAELRAVLESFPDVPAYSVEATGAPTNWSGQALWLPSGS